MDAIVNAQLVAQHANYLSNWTQLIVSVNAHPAIKIAKLLKYGTASNVVVFVPTLVPVVSLSKIAAAHVVLHVFLHVKHHKF
jgi:hypothetical protein